MALTADKERFIEKEGKLQAHNLKAAAVVFKGGICLLDGGELIPASAVAGAVMAGIAYEKGDQAAGDVQVRVMRKGAFEMGGSGFVATDVGLPMYASDDNTVSNVQGANEVCVGTCIEVLSATAVLVDIDRV